MTQARNIVRPNFVSPLPWVPKWVAGRFYDCPVCLPTLNTAAHGNTPWAEPFFVPQPIALASVGVEVTSGATAGALLRFALYDSRYDTWMPNRLLIDMGTTAADVIGFRSVSTTYYIVQPGCYWFCSACSGATTATVRTLGNTSLVVEFFSMLSFPTLSGPVGAWAIRWPTDNTVVTTGFPSLFPVIGISVNATDAMTFTRTSDQHPRIMVGV